MRSSKRAGPHARPPDLRWITCIFLAVAISADPPRTLSLLVWGDLHGDPSPKLFSWVDSLRREADSRHQPLLALDAGDSFFGSDLAFVTGGTSTAGILNLVKPDAITLGSNDFWWSRDRLDTLVASLETPVLTSNIVFDVTDKPYGGKSWSMWDFDGLRVGVIGVAHPDLQAADRPNKTYDLRTSDPTESVPTALDAMRPQKPNLVIVLSHAGKEADLALAQSAPELQLIVGSKDEAVSPAVQSGSTWIVRSATGSAQLTRVDLTLTDSGWSLTENVLAPPARLSVPKEWKPTFDSLAGILKSREDEVLDTLREAWPKTTREGKLGNFLADALRQGAQADIALWPGSDVRGGLPKGKVTVGQLWKALPSPQPVSVFELPGSDIVKLLFRQMSKPSDYLFLSGASCTPDSSKFGGSSLEVFVDQKPILPSEHYKIAIPESIRDHIYDLTGFSLESAAPVEVGRWDRDLIEEYARTNHFRTTLGRVPSMYGTVH